MDFLDPRKKRRHQIRLLIGYVLVTIAIALTATILVYWAYGYSFNRQTGNVVENGLLFLDSKPGGATIYLNGKGQNSNTSARLILNAGTYELTFKKDGYLDWQHKVVLDGRSVTRIVYPLLFPKEPKPQNIKSYSSVPTLVTESPDRRWLLVLVPGGDPRAPTFDMYDTGKPTETPQPLAIASQLLTNADKPGSSLSIIGWSNDNNHVLIKHDFADGSEFIIVNRTDAAASVNLNRAFNSNPSSAALFNKKTDQIYIYSQSDGSLLLGDVSKGSLQPLLKRVLAYKPLDAGRLLYVTDQDAPAGQVLAKILESGKSYLLTSFPAGSKYLIEASQFQSHWYYVAGSDNSSRINIYKDPLNSLKDSSKAKADPLLALINSGAQNLVFSANSRFIGVQNGSKFAVYDIENQERYQFSLPFTLQTPFEWMDGHRWIGSIEGSVFVMDFDAQNQHKLVPAINDEVFFDRDYNRMFNLVTVSGANPTALQMTDLRAGNDLPK